VISYLGDFLFAPQRAESPVRMLSGGERNRLLLATLFARPATCWSSTSPPTTSTSSRSSCSSRRCRTTRHRAAGEPRRRFLDNVVTQTLASAGDGQWREYVGGYSDWLEQRPETQPAQESSPAPRAPSP